MCIRDRYTKECTSYCKGCVFFRMGVYYTREQAAYPIDQTNKFWPAVSRIDNVYGDRNLVCSCANYFDET